ncbi:MAG: hypothetical protein ACTSQE_16380, partial [Candidatus Heimdallarchaeaceae archaeon]
YKEILDSKKLIGQIKLIEEAFVDLETVGVSAFHKLVEESKNLADSAGVEKWSTEAREAINTMRETSYENKDFQKVWQNFNKIIEAGIGKFETLKKEFIDLKDKQKALKEEMYQLDLQKIIYQYDLLGVSISSAESRLSGLISATSKLKNKEDETRQSVISAKAELYKLSGAMKTASSSGKEYDKVREDWIAQSKIIRILQERERRARYEADKQVGMGIRSIEEMSERTEKYIRTEEDLKISLAKASAEMKKAKYGTDEYNRAQANYLAISKAVRDAHREVTKASSEELLNKMKLQGEYSNIISKVETLQKEYGKETANINTRIQKEKQLISEREETVKDLEKNKESEKKIIELIKNKQEVLKKVFENEKKQIELRRKADPEAYTAMQAFIDKENAAVRYQNDSIKLQKEREKAAEREQGIMETLGREYADQEKKKRAQIEKTIVTLAKLREEYDKWVDKVAEGLTVSFNYKDAKKDFIENFIDPLFNKTYEIKWKMKPLPTEAASAETGSYFGGVIRKAYGGIVPARVTAGEGYIPPNQVLGNLNMLNSLNGGNSIGSVPRAIAQFTGPGGVDNIPTYLPTGSYVLSKKGMDAYERSLQQGAKTFQEGGEVSEETMFEGPNIPQVGSFTINVQKGNVVNSYPVQGDISVLQKLKEDLEEDKMTRLN